MRARLEVADIFCRHGDGFRAEQGDRRSNAQRWVMAAEACRTAALSGHVKQCEHRGETRIAYNSFRNRHCPKCQGLARAQCLADRRAELLADPYFHVVFTMPEPLAAIALQNKALAYDILFKSAAETIRVIAADLNHLGGETQIRFSLDAGEFMRRFLMHVLPKSFRRVRHFGFLANACCAGELGRIRAALDIPEPAPAAEPADYRKRYAMRCSPARGSISALAAVAG
jgi:hypothetical protein